MEKEATGFAESADGTKIAYLTAGEGGRGNCVCSCLVLR